MRLPNGWPRRWLHHASCGQHVQQLVHMAYRGARIPLRRACMCYPYISPHGMWKSRHMPQVLYPRLTPSPPHLPLVPNPCHFSLLVFSSTSNLPLLSQADGWELSSVSHVPCPDALFLDMNELWDGSPAAFVGRRNLNQCSSQWHAWLVGQVTAIPCTSSIRPTHVRAAGLHLCMGPYKPLINKL